MLIVRCKDCHKEISSHPTKSQSCGCPNMMTVKDDSVTALDLGRVVMVSSDVNKKQQSLFSPQELQFQEERRKRKVRRLDFDVK